MKNKKVLINFQMPASTKERFDRFCEITGKSKTSVLNSLVEDHLVYQSLIQNYLV
jgi:predicted DNA-binding protein